jgi:hypothetical protein
VGSLAGAGRMKPLCGLLAVIFYYIRMEETHAIDVPNSLLVLPGIRLFKSFELIFSNHKSHETRQMKPVLVCFVVK